MKYTHDMAILGAGPAGLVGARLAARLGARVVLVEHHRIGGDCTWTGCVPSKALLRAGHAAHEIRHAARFGIDVGRPDPNMSAVRVWLHGAIQEVHAAETPESLTQDGIEVVMGAAAFTDSRTLTVGARTIRPRRVLICTGARPAIPNVAGLDRTPHLTYEQLFNNDRLPARLLVLGAGPIGVEIAQAYRRLGAEVTIIGPHVLGREEPEVQTFVKSLLEDEGVIVKVARVLAASGDHEGVVLDADGIQVRGDMMLVAAGRQPNTDDLQLDRAGVTLNKGGIQVDPYLRTTAPGVYAAGDVLGGPQFTHLAAWQGFQAVRNALLPGRSRAFSQHLPWTTFLEPEVARVGLTEAQARGRYGSRVTVHVQDLNETDRAICDDARDGFIKVVLRPNGRLLGATIVASRAGEMIAEVALALRHRISWYDLASVMHPYPSWALAIQQLASETALNRFVTSPLGKIALRLSGLGRS